MPSFQDEIIVSIIIFCLCSRNRYHDPRQPHQLDNLALQSMSLARPLPKVNRRSSYSHCEFHSNEGSNSAHHAGNKVIITGLMDISHGGTDQERIEEVFGARSTTSRQWRQAIPASFRFKIVLQCQGCTGQEVWLENSLLMPYITPEEWSNVWSLPK